MASFADQARLRRRCMAAALVLSGALTAAAGESRLPAFQAEYDIRAFGLVAGRTTLSLDYLSDGSGELTEASGTTGLAAIVKNESTTERSRFDYLDGRVRPMSYRMERTGEKQVQVEAIYDWDAGQLQATGTYGQQSFPLEAHFQDRASLYAALMLDLLGDQLPESYPVFSRKKVSRYMIEVQGTETVNTDLGSHEAVRVQRGDAEDERYTILWCDPQLSYLPVQIAHFRDGDEEFRAILKTLKMD